MINPIETERLTIRDHGIADMESVHQYCSDEAVLKYMPWKPSNLEGTRKFLDKVIACQNDEERNYFYLAVVTKATQNLIGAVSLYIEKPQDKSAWLLYRFAKEAWGHGYATEASKAMIEFGFNELKLHRICAKCDVLNIASARVLEKCGMTQEGLLREECWQKGRWRDSFMFAILEQEWPDESMERHP